MSGQSMSDLRCLLMHEYYADLFLHAGKCWDIRSTPTNIREKVGILATKQMMHRKDNILYCTADLVDCFPLTRELFDANRRKHLLCVSYDELPPNYRYVWVFNNIRPVCEAVKKKPGSRVWCTVDVSHLQGI